MYSHLSALQISHADVRWANIVSAPENTSGPPNRWCAHHGKYHPWRIVDFELSKKTLSDAGECNYHYQCMVDTLLSQLANGCRY